MKNSYEPTREIQEEEQGISFADILATIKKHLLAIILFLSISAVAGFVGAHVRDSIKPTYTANATIMVAYSNTDAINQSAYSYSNSIAETVASFIKDDAVLTSVASDFNITTKDIRSNLTVNQKSGNLIISLSYNSEDREQAANVLNDIVLTAKNTADRVVENEPVHPFLYKNISLLTSADVNKVGKESHTFKYTAIAAALGVVLAFIYVFFFEMFNNSFKNREDVEKTLGVPLLGVVPHYEIDPNKQVGGKK